MAGTTAILATNRRMASRDRPAALPPPGRRARLPSLRTPANNRSPPKRESARSPSESLGAHEVTIGHRDAHSAFRPSTRRETRGDVSHRGGHRLPRGACRAASVRRGPGRGSSGVAVAVVRAGRGERPSDRSVGRAPPGRRRGPEFVPGDSRARGTQWHAWASAARPERGRHASEVLDSFVRVHGYRSGHVFESAGEILANRGRPRPLLSFGAFARASRTTGRLADVFYTDSGPLVVFAASLDAAEAVGSCRVARGPQSLAVSATRPSPEPSGDGRGAAPWARWWASRLPEPYPPVLPVPAHGFPTARDWTPTLRPSGRETIATRR